LPWWPQRPGERRHALLEQQGKGVEAPRRRHRGRGQGHLQGGVELVQSVGKLAHLRRGQLGARLGREVGGEVAQGGAGLLAQVQGVLDGILVGIRGEWNRRDGTVCRREESGSHQQAPQVTANGILGDLGGAGGPAGKGPRVGPGCPGRAQGSRGGIDCIMQRFEAAQGVAPVLDRERGAFGVLTDRHGQEPQPHLRGGHVAGREDARQDGGPAGALGCGETAGAGNQSKEAAKGGRPGERHHHNGVDQPLRALQTRHQGRQGGIAVGVPGLADLERGIPVDFGQGNLRVAFVHRLSLPV
jgi:hypothetical protein